MRTWFWTLLLAVVAVALAVFLREYPGRVLIVVGPTFKNLTLMQAAFILLGVFVTLYIGLRVLAWLVAIPHRMQAWRGRRAQARDHELLERGWISLLEGRFAHAEKDFGKLLAQTKVRSRKVLACLSCARADHALGEFERRDRMLESAREQADSEAGLTEAVASASADMLLDQGRAQEALALLSPLQDGGARHLHTMRLLLRAETALHNHERIFALARGLLRRNAIDKSEGERLLDMAGAARLRAAMASDSWRVVWKELKSDERLLPEIAQTGAAAFEMAGDGNESARILEAAIAVKFKPLLVAAYARCEAQQVPRRLAKAETWLHKRPADPELLTALGMLCLNGQLWGQAERYLLRSLSRHSNAQTHALLGSLYDHLNRPGDAVKHWRLATSANMALPVLVSDVALPAADIGADPCHLDAEGGYSGDEFETYNSAQPAMEQAAPAAADYVLDPQARMPGPQPVAAPRALRSAVDIEDYFDSAPIPAASFGGTDALYTPAEHEPSAKSKASAKPGGAS